MPAFSCQTCGASFEVPQAAIDKYPGWRPKRCRACGGGGRGSSARRGRLTSGGSLTLAQVLARYRGGPSSGVFTDGSAVPNPGPGGWGVVWVEAGEIRAERRGHDPATTNNRMELTALIEAFRLLPEDSDAVVRTDSRLCVDTIETWAPGWERKGWRKKGGPILNLELVQELLALRRAHAGCTLTWIEAHVGNRWNEYADSLSTAWLRKEA